MFTGLVECRGVLLSREPRGPGARLRFRTPLGGHLPGESVAVDGACLTVCSCSPPEGPESDRGAWSFDVDASAETLARTTLGELSPGFSVNLERALRVGDRLGGHLVTGHVDGVGSLVRRAPLGESVAMTFSFPPELGRLVAQKGSIAVSGVSLTVNEVTGTSFDVVIIPRTLAETTLGTLAPGDRVNLEVDLVARYVARLLEAP